MAREAGAAAKRPAGGKPDGASKRQKTGSGAPRPAPHKGGKPGGKPPAPVKHLDR